MSSYESLGPGLDTEQSTSLSLAEKEANKGRFYSAVRSVGDALTSKKVLKSLLFGQGLSLLLSGTGVTSGLLQLEGVDVPLAQSFPMYCLLCLLFTTQLAFREGERSILSILYKDGWKYALLALIDVEANYLVVKAYAYTSITSVQMLDCFSIASVLVLSRVFLHTVYRHTHYIGVLLSVVGLGGLIGADVLSGKNDSDGNEKNAALGDVLVIAGAILYGVSNVGQEFVVKNYQKSEFLGMIGFFGSLVSGIQVILVERDDLSNVDFSSYKIVLPFAGFVLFLFLIYTCMSYVIEQTSATLTNISILSADFYSLLIGIFVFKYSFHFLYFIAFVFVILGVAIYSLIPTSASSSAATSVNNATDGEE